MSSCKNRSRCKSARLFYYDLLDPETAGSVPKQVQEHVACCPQCQSDMNRLREALASAGEKHDTEQSRRDRAVIELLSLHFAWAGMPVGCTEVKPFLPSLADPLLRIRQQTPITAHVENCKACFEQLSTLIKSGLNHEQLCRVSRIIAGDPDADTEITEPGTVMPMVKKIMERPDSGVTTLFTLEKPDGKGGAPDASNSLRPFKVEVIGTETEPYEREHWASILEMKRFLKPALAAAAVILIGFAMFFSSMPARAVSPEQIYETIRGAGNIHISQFTPGNAEPVQEIWVSRSRGIYMTRTGPETVLFDTAARLIKSKATPNSATEVVNLTESKKAAIKQQIGGTVGVTPSTDIANLPPGSKWSKITDSTVEPEVRDCEVYELTWTEENSADEPVSWKWRCFVESASGQPRRTEYYRRSTDDEQYIPHRYTIVKYLGKSEIGAAIAEASF